MPKTEQIVSLKSQLDSLSTGADSTHVRKLISSLDKADKSMMDWMHQFSIDSLGKMDVEKKMIYLQSQYQRPFILFSFKFSNLIKNTSNIILGIL
jgi:hypothetical protein